MGELGASGPSSKGNGVSLWASAERAEALGRATALCGRGPLSVGKAQSGRDSRWR